MRGTSVHVWLDPSCPWAWQAHIWLRDLETRGVVDLTYGLFSLELNASEPGTAFAEAAPRYGHALAALSLARREAGHRKAGDLYAALGELVHDRKRSIGLEVLREAAEEAGLPGLGERASAAGSADELAEEYRAARALDVFGVPTLRIDDGKTMYGPILAVGPTGDDGISLWRAIESLLRRDAFFELKRWPRDLRPGGRPTGPS